VRRAVAFRSTVSIHQKMKVTFHFEKMEVQNLSAKNSAVIQKGVQKSSVRNFHVRGSIMPPSFIMLSRRWQLLLLIHQSWREDLEAVPTASL
jgi:hypothetical protein